MSIFNWNTDKTPAQRQAEDDYKSGRNPQANISDATKRAEYEAEWWKQKQENNGH